MLSKKYTVGYEWNANWKMEFRHYVMICKNCGERIRSTSRSLSNDVVYDASVKSLVV